MGRWTSANIPALSGRKAVVTGANSGLGLETAKGLASAGCHVIMASRDADKTERAAKDIRERHPGAQLTPERLDLASLASVRAFAERVRQAHPELHILCNNAGVMALPHRETEDGFEMQLGINHLGHFALTGQLLDCLVHTPGARIVTTTSMIQKDILFEDPNWKHSYDRWDAYGQSKRANILFAYELQRRLCAAGAEAISVACHPGYAATQLQFVGAAMSGARLSAMLMRLSNRLFAQSAAMGALPCLYAATAPDVEGNDYIGPAGFLQRAGYPKKLKPSRHMHDPDAAGLLWSLSEEYTGVRYAF